MRRFFPWYDKHGELSYYTKETSVITRFKLEIFSIAQLKDIIRKNNLKTFFF